MFSVPQVGPRIIPHRARLLRRGSSPLPSNFLVAIFAYRGMECFHVAAPFFPEKSDGNRFLETATLCFRNDIEPRPTTGWRSSPSLDVHLHGVLLSLIPRGIIFFCGRDAGVTLELRDLANIDTGFE